MNNISKALVLGETALTLEATAASADVVCNEEGDCWQVRASLDMRLPSGYASCPIKGAGEKARATRWRELGARFPKLGELMDEAEDDVLAHISFPKKHWQQLRSTNPLERLNGEIKRRTDVVAIFPNKAAVVRLVEPCCSSRRTSGVQRRYMTLETFEALSDDPQAKPYQRSATEAGLNGGAPPCPSRFARSAHYSPGKFRASTPPSR